jgi:hypothetical protein
MENGGITIWQVTGFVQIDYNSEMIKKLSVVKFCACSTESNK